LKQLTEFMKNHNLELLSMENVLYYEQGFNLHAMATQIPVEPQRQKRWYRFSYTWLVRPNKKDLCFRFVYEKNIGGILFVC